MVDVLAVMQDCLAYLDIQDDLAGYEVQQMQEAKDSISELMSASLQFQECANDLMTGGSLRFEEAETRLTLALMRCQDH